MNITSIEEIEKMHEELHLEAERFIIELKEALKEQEIYYKKIQYESNKKIQALQDLIYKLQLN